MTKTDKEMWLMNIQTVAQEVAEKYSEADVKFVIERYGAEDIERLSMYDYPDVFAELQLLADND